MLLTHPRDEEVTAEVISEFIKLHQMQIPMYVKYQDYYLGNHEILHRENRAEYKPDNRVVVNYAKKIVDTFNGYFIGIPVKVSHDNKDIDETITMFRKLSDLEDTEAELAKLTSIFGHAFEYVFQNEDTQTEVGVVNPLSAFIVYDDAIKPKPLFGVYYQVDTKGQLTGEVMDNEHKYSLSGMVDEVSLSDEVNHYYDGVPLIEYVENEERQPIFFHVMTMIDALNSAISGKTDDLEYFADAYLAIMGAEIDEDTLNYLKENRIINIAGEGSENITIEFLEKPNADGLQENLIDRLIDLIFEVSMIANVSDETFNAQASGVALEWKQQDMKNLAIMKERKFRKAMQERYKLFFSLPTNAPQSLRDEWLNISYAFTRNVPHNLADEAETAMKLQGIVSQETQLEILSNVDDAQREIARMEAEQEAEPVYDFQMTDEPVDEV